MRLTGHALLPAALLAVAVGALTGCEPATQNTRPATAEEAAVSVPVPLPEGPPIVTSDLPPEDSAPITGPSKAPLPAEGDVLTSGQVLDRLRVRLSSPTCILGPNNTRWRHKYAGYPQHFADEVVATLPMMLVVLDELEQHHLPGEFAFIPIVESWYRPETHSFGGASGMWQFLAETARNNGATVTGGYDGRLSVLDSTEAAMNYLGKLQGMFNDWRLSAMAYNSGEYRLAKTMSPDELAARGAGGVHYRRPGGLAFGTYEYVSKMRALDCMIAQPQRQGIPFDPSVLITHWIPYTMPADVGSLDELARRLDTDAEQLKAFNRGFRGGRADNEAPRTVLVPASTRSRWAGAGAPGSRPAVSVPSPTTGLSPATTATGSTATTTSGPASPIANASPSTSSGNPADKTTVTLPPMPSAPATDTAHAVPATKPAPAPAPAPPPAPASGRPGGATAASPVPSPPPAPARLAAPATATPATSSKTPGSATQTRPLPSFVPPPAAQDSARPIQDAPKMPAGNPAPGGTSASPTKPATVSPAAAANATTADATGSQPATSTVASTPESSRPVSAPTPADRSAQGAVKPAASPQESAPATAPPPSSVTPTQPSGTIPAPVPATTPPGAATATADRSPVAAPPSQLAPSSRATDANSNAPSPPVPTATAPSKSPGAAPDPRSDATVRPGSATPPRSPGVPASVTPAATSPVSPTKAAQPSSSRQAPAPAPAASSSVMPGPTASPAPVAAPPQVATPRTCKVELGDSLESIAQSHGVKLEDLRAWNHLAPDAKLYVDQVLKLEP